jgi:hypothetical protein
MTATKIFNIISPFTLLTVLGILIIGEGFLKWGQPNNPLQFIFGVPLLIFPILFHYLVLKVCNNKTAVVWLVEGIIVAILAYQFLYVW